MPGLALFGVPRDAADAVATEFERKEARPSGVEVERTRGEAAGLDLAIDEDRSPLGSALKGDTEGRGWATWRRCGRERPGGWKRARSGLKILDAGGFGDASVV